MPWSRCWIGDGNALDLNMSIKLWSMVVGRWWFENAWRLLGREHGTKWSFNMIMIPSTWEISCKNGWHHNHFDSFNDMHNLWTWITLNTSGHFSNSVLTNLRHLQEVSKNCGSMCVQCILVSIKRIAWRLMRARHKKLTMCWRVRVSKPINKGY